MDTSLTDTAHSTLNQFLQIPEQESSFESIGHLSATVSLTRAQPGDARAPL
jgi:hypothetical protein